MPLLVQLSSLDPLNTLSQRLGYLSVLPHLLRGMYLVKGNHADGSPGGIAISGIGEGGGGEGGSGERSGGETGGGKGGVEGGVDGGKATSFATTAAHAHAALALLCGVRGGDGAATAQHGPLRAAARATLRELCALEAEGRVPPADDAGAAAAGVDPSSRVIEYFGAKEKLEDSVRQVYSAPLPVGTLEPSLLFGLLLWHGSDPALSAPADRRCVSVCVCTHTPLSLYTILSLPIEGGSGRAHILRKSRATVLQECG